MKRLLRWFWNGLTVLSLLLCVATAVLWVRSCWVHDLLMHAHDGRSITFNQRNIWVSPYESCTSNDGRLLIRSGFQGWVLDPYQSGLRWTRSDVIAVARPPFFKFVYEPRNPVLPGIPFSFELSVSHAIPFAAFLLLPLGRGVAYRSRLRRRTRSVGHCPSCGYDLRASPQRCPECGTAIGPVVESTPRRC